MLSAVSLILTAEIGQAQLKFGGTLGLSKSNMAFSSSDTSFSFDPRRSYTFGAFLDYPLTSKVDLRSGVNFTQKGFQDSKDFFDGQIETKVNLSYLSIPLIAQYKYYSSPNTPYALAGMEIGILNSAESVLIVSGLPKEIGFITNGTTTTDINDSLSTFDLTWNIGGGYEMEFNSGKVFAEIQFSFGLNDVDNVDDSIRARSRGILIGIGYIY